MGDEKVGCTEVMVVHGCARGGCVIGRDGEACGALGCEHDLGRREGWAVG